MNKKLFNLIKISLGIIILVILFYKLGFKEILGTLKLINLWFLIPVYLLVFFSILLTTTGVFALLKPLRKSIPFSRLYKYVALSWSVGLFFPGRIGELSLLYFFKKHKINIGQGSSVWLMDKIISLIVVSIFSIVGFLMFFGRKQTITLVVFLLLIFFIIFAFIISDRLRDLIKKIILRKYSKNFKGFSKLFFTYFKYHKKLLLINAFIKINRVVVNSLMIFFIFLSFKTVVPLYYILIIWAIEMIISMIPITPGGSGIKQSIGAYLFNIVGVSLPVIGARYVISILVQYTTGLFFLLTTKKKKDI